MPNTSDKVNIWYGANGSETEEVQLAQGLGAKFKRGDLLGVAGGVDLWWPGIGLVGIALKDSQPGTPHIPICKATANLRWVLPVTGRTAIDIVGMAFPLHRASDGKWLVNTHSHSSPSVVVTAIHPQYAMGEMHGWVEVRFVEGLVK